jgi:hypothetical protein
MGIIKKIIKIGNSYGIVLTKFEIEARHLEVGDYIDVGDLVRIRKGNKPGGKK